jgi:hypothetical protein
MKLLLVFQVPSDETFISPKYALVHAAKVACGVSYPRKKNLSLCLGL